MSGWWFGTFFIFPYIGNNHPNRLIFFRGVQTTNQMFLSESHTSNVSVFTCHCGSESPSYSIEHCLLQVLYDDHWEFQDPKTEGTVPN